ncbi:hypothetical protein [Fibrobacter sp. UWB10]|uniref:hypothetical protein n=1 Tax=Fibrobacter sp. UWB10 TaxID=1896201 RepID=UPI001B018F56|nr:hypothetical protein [Fibrobacter sp. UWB10]MBO7513658.1 hypothetical protein [Fibrobacter sp.]SMP57515.1 hypothetical protein SAMN05720465_2682 [Fibrobacter sp. UWB10]
MKRLILLALSALLLCSCANKSLTRYETLAPVLKEEGFEGTIKKIEKEKDDIYGEKSAFLYHFDEGMLYHYAGKNKESIKHFEQAEQIYEDLYTKSVTNEAAALATNDNMRPYRARPFELLLMYQYQILNYLAVGDLDGALVEVRRAQIASEALYQKDKDKVNDNGWLRYLSALVYEMSGEEDDAAIAYLKAAKAFEEGNVKMPKEVWEYINESLRKMDRADDLKALKTPMLAQTPKATQSREKGQEIIVVGYAGHSPILGEMYLSGTFVSAGAINLTYKDGETGKIESFTLVAPPVAGAGSNTFHIGFALPQKKKLPQHTNMFTVSLDGSKHTQIEKVANIDAELDKNMKDENASTMIRTATRVVIRTIAAQQAKKATNTGNGIFDLVKNIAVDVGQTQLEQADLRVGLFMPNSINVTRIPVDAGTHELVISALDSQGRVVGEYKLGKVKVAKGQKKIVLVPSIE